ncbi:membrane-spanning 4-domains subfamily A member 4A [Misgurnus anguillicaudatus]|uniref:membrane-spanning 4-domains subfamily A member 4A n=1 Tax=Misgurnus anguillicaudatus TaxID=75329 RepID=UPI003CCFD324
MASSMITAANGVKVVTHVIPLEDKMESPDPKASKVEVEKPKLPPRTRMFQKGRPMTLGLVQMFTGFVMMSLCTITILIDGLQTEFIVFLGVPFVVSGIVAIVANKSSHPSLIKATLAMTVICALLAAAGIGYFSWELSLRPGGDECTNTYWDCWSMRTRYYQMLDGVKGLLLVLSCLELCVCIALSIFSIKAIGQDEAKVDSSSTSSLLKNELQ